VSRNLSTPTGVDRIEDRRVRVRSVLLNSEREVDVTDGGSDDGDDILATVSSGLYRDVLVRYPQGDAMRLEGRSSTLLVRRKACLQLASARLRVGAET